MVQTLQRNSDHKTLFLISCLLFTCFFLFPKVSAVSSLDNLWLDFAIRQRAELNPPDDRIVVIDIDDASLNNMAPLAGGWPWPRAIHAEMVELLQQQKPAAIVFDILFADPDIYNPDSDQYFSEVLRQTNNVYLPILHLKTDADAMFPRLDQYPETLEVFPPSEVKQVSGPATSSDISKPMPPHASLVLPKAVDPKAWRLGTINFQIDPDGIGRRYSPVIRIDGWGLESLPAKVAYDLTGFRTEQNEVFLDWYGDEEPYKRLPYHQVYSQLTTTEPNAYPGSFKDKIIVIGSTAAGLHDIQATPISGTYPGVFILATAIDGFLSQRFLSELTFAQQLMLFALLYFILMLFLFMLENVLAALGALIAFISALFILSYWSLVEYAYQLPVVGWSVLYLFGAILFFSHRHLQQQKQAQKTVEVFSRFLDPKVVKILLEQGTADQALLGKSTRVTILFTDIREFTHLSEYRSATEIVDLLNQYFSRQVGVIFQHQGTLDKFIGDAIMAFWGEPVEDPNQEVSAINAALEMIEQMKKFRREFGLFDFDIGIGIHTGEVVVGAIGTPSRYDYTAIGDAVNLASRIEGLTKETGYRLLVSEQTRQACGDAFDFVLIGDYKVKGREELVTIYQPRRLCDES
ncbi:CHASE2 domain-containing protein [Neptuniibacter sp.]|uniref:CHASE2 domain-containing protein n=1 Tax=Neptuniibacter sp. TaxID=1962643 RepID=UPI0026354F00|nr:adenylate/guanylate cyclase domain-containing protein [Neptuniibacter sp.]MCP4597848.1 adenylate/guanylate cyclase domain-containing protein [Neptuniibacter sp.]